MERGQVHQNAIIIPETTPGVYIAPTKRLQCTYIVGTPDAPVRMYRPGGMRYDVEATLEKEMTGFTYEGAFCYTDLVYILHSLMGVPTGTGTWTWKPALYTQDSIKTFSMVQGNNASAAEGWAYGVFNSLRARFTKGDASINGDGFGQKLDETPTIGTIVNVAKRPVSPKSIGAFISDDGETFTRLTRCLEIEWIVRGVLGQLFTLNETTESYDDIVPLAPEMGFNVVLAHNSVSKGWMDDLRTGVTKYFRFWCVGPVIGAGPGTYLIQVTAPIKYRDPRPGENQGTVGRTYNLACHADDDFAGVMEVVVTNEMSAL